MNMRETPASNEPFKIRFRDLPIVALPLLLLGAVLRRGGCGEETEAKTPLIVGCTPQEEEFILEARAQIDANRAELRTNILASCRAKNAKCPPLENLLPTFKNPSMVFCSHYDASPVEAMVARCAASGQGKGYYYLYSSFFPLSTCARLAAIARLETQTEMCISNSDQKPDPLDILQREVFLMCSENTWLSNGI